VGNWYWFLVLRFNGCAMGMLFAFGFLDYVGALPHLRKHHEYWADTRVCPYKIEIDNVIVLP
jgi:hypothetical protein